MRHRESTPAVARRTGEEPVHTLTHGRHGRPKPLGGQLRLPAIKVSGAAMAMSTVVGISIATTWLITAQQRVGYSPRMSSVDATPTGGNVPGATGTQAPLAGGAPAAGSAGSPTALHSGGTVTRPTGRAVRSGPSLPATDSPAGPTTVGDGQSAVPSSPAATTADGDLSADRAPATASTSPSAGATSTEGAGTQPLQPAATAPGLAGTPEGQGPGHAAGFRPGTNPPSQGPEHSSDPGSNGPSSNGPSSDDPRPNGPGSNTQGSDDPSSDDPSETSDRAPGHAPILTGWGGTVASAGLGQRHTVTLTVTEPLAAMETELRLTRGDATAGAMAWSTLPGARVTLLQQDGMLVYRFAPPPGEDVLPGTYTFTVQGARSAIPAVGGLHDTAGRWTASGFALRFPQAVAAHGAFTSAKP